MTHPPFAPTPQSEPPVPSRLSGAAEPPRWRSQQLLQGAREVQIEHQGLVYRLRVTSLGKLILTK